MADRRHLIPEIVRPGHRNGRHVNHDPRSLRYLAAPAGVQVTPKSVRWERRIPILDQGQLGSCTANATVSVLGCAPYYDTLPPEVQRALADARTAEAFAVQLYRETTATDPFPGQWEPDDTGSDGLSVAKAAQARGLVSGYQHVTSLAAAHVAIQAGPFITGTVWLAGMETPSREGIVTATGVEEGGHEYACTEYDATRDLWWFDNSWTDSWGRAGRFAMSSQTFATLLAKDGDATPFVPITAPAPQPSPAPVTPPGPVSPVTPTPAAPTVPWAQLQPFMDSPHSWAKATTAARVLRQLQAQQQ